MASLIMKKCPNCGAGVQLDPAASHPYTIVCEFCRTSVAVYPPQKTMPGRPAPPRPVGPNVIVMDSRAGTEGARKLGSIIAATVALLPLLILLGTFARPCVDYANARFSPWYFPAKCEANQTLAVKGRTARSSEPFFQGAFNCKVKIVDCNLTGPVILQGGGNTEVILQNSKIRVTRAVLDGDSNTKVLAEGGSVVTTDTAVAIGNSHVEVEVVGSTIQSAGVLVKAQTHGKVRAKEKSHLAVSKGIGEGLHFDLTLDDSTLAVEDSVFRDSQTFASVTVANGSKVTGAHVPFRGAEHSTIDIDGARVEGEEGGCDLETHSTVRLRDHATVVAKTGDAIRLGDYGRLEVGSGSLVQAQRAAVRFRSYGRLVVSGGQLRGAEAFVGDSYTEVKLRKATAEGTRTVGRNSRVEEE